MVASEQASHEYLPNTSILIYQPGTLEKSDVFLLILVELKAVRSIQEVKRAPGGEVLS